MLVALIASALLGACLAPAAFAEGPIAEPAKAKKKKCKKKPKSKKKGKGCKKRGGSGSGSGSGSPGLPGKPVEPDPPVSPQVASFTVAPPTVLGGTSSVGEVTLAQPAEAGGQDVSLTSGEPARAMVPASVEVPEGQSSVDFSIDTTFGPTVIAPINAYIGLDSNRAAELKVVEKASVDRLTLARECYPSVGLTAFGANRVFLDVPAGNDTVIGLQSSDPLVLEVPSTVTVPDGSTAAIFGVDTLAASSGVTVTATLDGVGVTDSASIRDASSPAPAVSAVSVSPNSVQPGAGSTGTVTLDCEAGPGGATVALATNSSQVGVPASVFVPEGSLTATFPVTTTTSADGNVTITATLGGEVETVLTVEQFGT